MTEFLKKASERPTQIWSDTRSSSLPLWEKSQGTQWSQVPLFIEALDRLNWDNRAAEELQSFLANRKLKGDSSKVVGGEEKFGLLYKLGKFTGFAK